MALTSIGVTGTFKNPDGSNATGNVTFRLNQVLQNSSGAVLADRNQVYCALVSGAFSTTLYATDDVGTLPTGGTYLVTENIVGSPVRQYNIAVPRLGGPINLATVATSTAIPPTASTVNLQDVSKTAPTDQQALVYVAATGKWTPVTLSGTNPSALPLAGGTMTGPLLMGSALPSDLLMAGFRTGDTFRRFRFTADGREKHGGPGTADFPAETVFVGTGNIGNEAQWFYWMTADIARGLVIRAGGNPTYFSTTDVRFPFMVVDKNNSPIGWTQTDSGAFIGTDNIGMLDTGLNWLLGVKYRHGALPKSLPAIVFGTGSIIAGHGDTGDAGTGDWFGLTGTHAVTLTPALTVWFPITIPAGVADTDTAQIAQTCHQIGKSVSTVTVVNTTTPTNLLSQTITGMVVGDRLRLIARGDYLNNSGAGVTYGLTVKIGATTVLTSDLITIPSAANTKQWTLDIDVMEYTDTAHQDIRAIWMLTAGSGSTMPNMPAAAGTGGAAGGAQSTVDMTTNPALSVQITMGTAAAAAQLRLLSWSLERIR